VPSLVAKLLLIPKESLDKKYFLWYNVTHRMKELVIVSPKGGFCVPKECWW